MPTPFPVPSKSALRALRNLALGTTCTLAFSTGVLTADRRRRIQAAREVRDNARRIRQYHAAGAAPTGNVEESSKDYGDGMWKSRESGKPGAKRGSVEDHKRLPSATLEREGAEGENKEVEKVVAGEDEKHTTLTPPHTWALHDEPVPPSLAVPAESARQSSISTKRHIPLDLKRTKALRAQHFPAFEKPLPPEVTQPRCHKASEEPAAGVKDTWYPKYRDRHLRLAHDITKLLSDGSEASRINAAGGRFLDAFEEGVQVDVQGLSEELVETAARLVQSYNNIAEYEKSDQILAIILRHGPIEESTFFKFEPDKIIKALVDFSGDPSTWGTITGDIRSENSAAFSAGKVFDPNKVQRACKLYMMHSKSNDMESRHDLMSLGPVLCSRAWAIHDTSLVQDVFRVYESYQSIQGLLPLQAVKWALLAAYETQSYAKVIAYFRDYYMQISRIGSDHFQKITRVVTDSIFKVQDFSNGVCVLFEMLHLAEVNGLQINSQVCLRIMNEDWRVHLDIERSQALFNRIQPYFESSINDAPRVYGAIIQHYVEEGDESAALNWYTLFRQASPLVKDRDIPIYGYLAQAKARRQDWDGVRSDFRLMRDLKPKGEDITPFEISYCNAFKYVLRLYVRSHSLNETEKFLQDFVDSLGVGLTAGIAHILIQKCLEEGEIDSVSRWVALMSSTGLEMGPALFNSILEASVNTWKFSWEEAYRLYELMSRLGNLKSLDDDIYRVMQRLAAKTPVRSSRPNNVMAAQRLKALSHRIPGIPDSYANVTDAMKVAVGRRNYAKALTLYDNALAKGLRLQRLALTIAVQSSLRLYPLDIGKALTMIQINQRKSQDTAKASWAVVLHQIRLANHEKVTHLVDIAQGVLSAVAKNPHNEKTAPRDIVSSMLQFLLVERRYRDTVDFWASISYRRGYAPIPLDIINLTLLLEAYLGMKDQAGVAWVFQMLTACRLVPSSMFKQRLLDARARERKYAKWSEWHRFLNKANEKASEARSIGVAQRAEAKKRLFETAAQAINVDPNKVCDSKIANIMRGATVEMSSKCRSTQNMDNISKIGRYMAKNEAAINDAVSNATSSDNIEDISKEPVVMMAAEDQDLWTYNPLAAYI